MNKKCVEQIFIFEGAVGASLNGDFSALEYFIRKMDGKILRREKLAIYEAWSEFVNNFASERVMSQGMEVLEGLNNNFFNI